MLRVVGMEATTATETNLNSMKTYTTLSEIPARFAFVTANALSEKREYRAHSSYASALNSALKSKAARTILRRAGSTSTFAAVS